MTAQPLTIYDELFNDIQDFRNASKQIDVFKRMKLVSKAKDLKLDAYDLHDFLGMIFCLENDVELAIEHHKIALEKVPRHFMILHNYFVTLDALGFFSEARELGEYMLVNFPNEAIELKTVNFMIKNLLVSGRLQEASNLLNELEKPKEYAYYEAITAGSSIFKEADLSDNEAENLQNLAFNVVRKKNLYLSSTEVDIVDGCVHYQIYVDLPVEEIFEVNWDVSEILAENVENMRSDVMLLEFKSVDILLERRES